MKTSSVDLIYLDPPFNSNRNYNAIYKDETGRPLPDQIDAFCDLRTLDEERERAIRTMPVLMRESGIEDHVADFLAFMDECFTYYTAPITGLPFVHGRTTNSYEKDYEAKWFDLLAL